MADDLGGTWNSTSGGDTGSFGSGILDSLGGAGNVTSALGSGISAVGNLFSSQASAAGYQKEAELYDQAAQLEGYNQQYAQASGRVQGILAARQATKTIGAQKAAVGAAGFEESGSNLYLLRDSQAQAGITQGMINEQTAINVSNYQAQQVGYQAQATGARQAAAAQQSSGILGVLGGIAGIASKFI